MTGRLPAMAVIAVSALGVEELPDHRLKSSAEVFHEIMSAPDKGIPRGLLRRAECVVIVPGLKTGAFVFGADYGRGFALCRHMGRWGGPAAVRIGGGSFGAQIGLESADVVMLVMDTEIRVKQRRNRGQFHLYAWH